jgi:CRISPR/Cas system-associated endoribonuclease Cas2
MSFLVAYDIADPRRLQRLGRFMERRALRLQKSVFWFDGDAAAADALLTEAAELLDLKEDVVQAWPVVRGESSEGLFRGVVRNVHPAGVILGPSLPLFVKNPESR